MRRNDLARWGLGALALLGVALTGAWADERSTYTNPVLDASFPDPTVIRVGKTLYAYGTGQVEGGDRNRFIVMSHTNGTDLVHWSAPRAVMALPDWASGAVWAPDVLQDPADPKRFVMYFSAETRDPATGKCLGVAVSTTGPDGKFVATGQPLDPQRACGKSYVNIDPVVFYDPRAKKRYLYWGSGRVPTNRMEIAPDLVHLTGQKQPVLAPEPVAGPLHYTNLIEGSWLLYRQNRYYYFSSGNNCCGADDAYAVTVWRSDSPTGPWTKFPGGKDGAILQANNHWAAPGHNGIFTDGAGQDWIIYHARRPNPSGKKPLPPRVLLYDRLDWSNPDGWPRVVTDASIPGTPSSGRMPAPVPFK